MGWVVTLSHGSGTIIALGHGCIGSSGARTPRAEEVPHRVFDGDFLWLLLWLWDIWAWVGICGLPLIVYPTTTAAVTHVSPSSITSPLVHHVGAVLSACRGSWSRFPPQTPLARESTDGRGCSRRFRLDRCCLVRR